MTTPRRPNGTRLCLVAAAFGLALAMISALATTAAGPVAAATAPNGSDWGSTGQLTSDSAVTLRWDNTGNPASSLVYRDGRQVIPHTGGKTYDDVDQKLADSYNAHFGTDDGLGGLEVKVSQTQGLVDQTVSLSVSGVVGGTNVIGGSSVAYLQVFQCWGGLTSAGKPDPDASEPDPATCEVGATGPDTRGGAFEESEGRFVGEDPLALTGDWASHYGSTTDDVPFTAISGQQSGSTFHFQNVFFDKTTTNELSNVAIASDGTAHRPFETQTSLESPGLGCGERPGSPSTPNCWLVIVPRVAGEMDTSGPIAPSLWAQRLQVRLGFRAVGETCPGGQARTLIGGSELLGAAASSWTPGVCAADKIQLGYTQLGDEVARNQFLTGQNPAILTSEPLPSSAKAAQVPVAVAAPVIGYSLTYLPECIGLSSPPATDAAAQSCGYANLSDLQEDWKRAGTQVRTLNLDARLVLKLLTQSYGDAILQGSGMPLSGWETTLTNGDPRPSGLAEDPEFVKLNPDLAHEDLSGTSPAHHLDHLIVEAVRSDGAAAIWQWIMADPAAKAFLDGCPDAGGMTINPFYSSRTYAECSSQKATLSAQADADRKATVVAPDYVDVPPVYPPDGSPFPLPSWQQYQPAGDEPLTIVDFLPPVNAMPDAGRDTAIGYQPSSTTWCDASLDSSCLPAPGAWKDPKIRQPASSLGLMGITDAATAARFQIPTANLCDSDGTHCVGADTASFEKAAQKFVPAGTTDLLTQGPADYAGGAYPLTLPVYAAISTKLPLAQRTAYATALKNIDTAGQVPGFNDGDLPPGYAPLTPNLVKLATTGLAALVAKKVTPPSSSSPSASPSETPTDTTTTGGDSDGSGVTPPGSLPTGPAPSTSSSASAVIGTQTVTMVTVAAGQERWPGITMPLGLGIALFAGLVGSVMQLRTRFRIGAR